MTSWLVFAQQAPAAPDAGATGGPPLMMLVMGLFALYIFIVVLPGGRRQKKEQEALLKSLKRGSKVITTSGIIGTVVSLKETEDEMVLRSEDARIKVRKSMVAQVVGTDESEAAK